MLWAMLYLETLDLGIYVAITLTLTTYLNIVAEKVHSFLTTVVPNATGPFQQNNVPCHTPKLFRNSLMNMIKSLRLSKSPAVNIQCRKSYTLLYGSNFYYSTFYFFLI